MVITIFIILVDLFAFIFMFVGFLSLNKKSPATFLWNKITKSINNKYVKQYNRTVAILYFLAGLSLLIVGMITNYLNFYLGRLTLILVIIAIFPTLSAINTFVLSSYYEKN